MKKNISELNPNPKNPRKIEAGKLNQLEKSLREFGSLDGFIYNVRTERLIGGHQRQAVFKKAEIVGDFVLWNGEKFPYREVNWDEAKEKAANIAANKGAGEWDKDLLGEWFSDLKALDWDLSLTMFDEEELANYLKPDTKEGLCDEDEVPTEVECNVKRGDLYSLGAHFLLCGDSTSSDDVSRLMNSEKADMVFTDPPYNHGSEDGLIAAGLRPKSFGKLKSAEWDKSFEITPALEQIEKILSENVSVYIFTSHHLAGDVWRWMKSVPGKGHESNCVWHKPNPMPSLMKRHWTWSTELICYMTRGKHTFNFPERGHALNLWVHNKEKPSNFEGHPTQKPVEVCLIGIEHSSSPGHLIYDPFLGSGSTLIACEKTNRKCYGMEIDPHYCQVIIDRWEKYTGKKASLLNTESKLKNGQ